MQLDHLRETNPTSLKTIGLLAFILKGREKYGKAEEQYRQLFKAAGEETVDEKTLRTSLDFGSILRNLGKNEEAIERYEQIADEVLNLKDDIHFIGIADVITGLAKELAALGRAETAEKILRLEIEKIKGEEEMLLTLALCQLALAEMLTEQERYAEV
ncbi:hypothetical protein G7Y89_g12274 [Cudoniella acicularis]|uniref:Tetratricopeptide repeat protein n=1 Tax=Cudoniella acicularis TaxID=354080 RepID=A0A8H4RBJ1_9HELO|nr:hypothetical protein G7Y89_g12274 [Cudoniella acicularis]